MIAPVPAHAAIEPAATSRQQVRLNGIDPVAAIKPATGGRGEAQRFLLQLDPGQIVSARVEARLPDGSFRVAVAGQELRMALPAGVAAGDTLKLTFIAHEPRPTFALHEAAQLATPAPVLSAAGRLVAAILPQAGAPAVLAPMSTAAPLLAALPADGAVLSASLQHTLAQSGLFYEAHQAEWVAGKFDLVRLRAEPQARLAPSAPQSAAGKAAAPGAATDAVADAAGTAAPTRLEQQLRPETAALVQQQLAALESGKVVLQLEIWPKQWMQWEVEEQARDAAHEADPQDAPPNWHTRLRLDLPRLGELNAALTLSSSGVQIRLDAASAASAALLQGRRAALHAALAEAGVPPAAIDIAHHEQP